MGKNVLGITQLVRRLGRQGRWSFELGWGGRRRGKATGRRGDSFQMINYDHKKFTILEREETARRTEGSSTKREALQNEVEKKFRGDLRQRSNSRMTTVTKS